MLLTVVMGLVSVSDMDGASLGARGKSEEGLGDWCSVRFERSTVFNSPVRFSAVKRILRYLNVG